MIDEDIARRQDLYAVKEAAARLCGIHPGDVEELDPDSDLARDVRHMMLVVESRIEKVDDSFFQPFPFLKIHKPPMAPRWLVCAIARDYQITNDLLPFEDEDDAAQPEPTPARPEPPTPHRSPKLRLLIAASDATVAVREHPGPGPVPTHKQRLADYIAEHAADYGLQLSENQIEDLAAVANIDPTPGRPTGKK